MSMISGIGGQDPAQKMQDMQKQSQQNYDAADANQDGVVSADEFLKVLSTQGVDSTKAAEFTNILDADGDGSITQEEHEKTMQDMQDRMSEMLTRMTQGQTYGKEQNVTDAGFDSFKAMLGTMASDSKDKDSADRLKSMQEKLETEGYSHEGVQTAMELVNNVAPPINTKA